MSFPGLERPVQRSSGDLERPAYLRNGVVLLIEIPGNTQLLSGEGVGSAAFPSSSTCCGQSCLGSLSNEVSLKLS